MVNIEAYRARAVVDALVGPRRPAAAIRALAQRADDESATPFERYAAGVLCEAGALQLTSPGKPELLLQHVSDSQVIRLTTPPGPAAPVRDTRVLEDAINRLTGIVGALEEGFGAQRPSDADSARARRRELFERHGVEYPLWSDTERGAHVQLPAAPSDSRQAAAFFNEIDWRLLDTVASSAHVYFQAAILANRNQVVFGAKAPHCSEWDVRTRLASILEGLEPTLRLIWRFDCDTSRSVATVHFTVPPIESFPSAVATSTDGALQPLGDRADAARISFALRSAALLAAACFGAGRVIEHAFVIGKDDAKTLASCAFERSQFVHETLPAIDARMLDTPAMRFDPELVAQTLMASHVDYATAERTPYATGLLSETRPDPWEDDRILPDDMQRLFHAKRIRDLDTSHYLGGSKSVIDEARADSHEAAVAAIAELEGVLDAMESHLAPPDDLPDARPLHCEHALARAAIALLDDELNVSAEAEAFLHHGDDGEALPLPTVYYYRAPTAVFHAHAGLADLYRKLGDARGAETQADHCIALAPTTPAGYALKAGVLADGRRFEEAANVLMGGLQLAVAEEDQAALLHDLAQLFQRLGRADEARALHVFTATLPGVYARQSAAFIKQIAGGANTFHFVRENMPEARRVIGACGIPLVTERTRNALVAHAALGLTNAHAPRAAAPYVALLTQHFPTNRAIQIACNSIRSGVD